MASREINKDSTLKIGCLRIFKKICKINKTIPKMHTTRYMAKHGLIISLKVVFWKVVRETVKIKI